MGCTGENGRKFVRAILVCDECGSPMVVKEINMLPGTYIDDRTIKSVFQCTDLSECGRHVYNKERSPIIKAKI